MAEEKQEGQKTVVSFIVGLLIGGLLVWAFSGPTTDAPTTQSDDDKEVKADKDQKTTSTKADEEKTTSSVSEDKGGTASDSAPVEKKLSVGDGKIVVNDQPVSTSIAMESATYPVGEGWVGIRDYRDGQLGYILGVVRFSEEQGLVPSSIILQTPTIAGREYAVVVFEESGDRKFSLADDKQIDTIFDTFTATSK
ncbi:MAG: hypothetical protein H6779_00660 [Candidatus Nomurabacteria bacterium]|nr:hypothetical protein [Candidatus Nomurabacteria bacterium]USN87941.1 MAG: hypothetical protein H6779_00660 [Candidatus Nomurabacteria bacterium]